MKYYFFCFLLLLLTTKRDSKMWMPYTYFKIQISKTGVCQRHMILFYIKTHILQMPIRCISYTGKWILLFFFLLFFNLTSTLILEEKFRVICITSCFLVEGFFNMKCCISKNHNIHVVIKEKKSVKLLSL